MQSVRVLFSVLDPPIECAYFCGLILDYSKLNDRMNKVPMKNERPLESIACSHSGGTVETINATSNTQ